MSDFWKSLFGGSDSESVNNSGGTGVNQGMNVSNGFNANYGVTEGGSFGTSTSSGSSSSSGGSSNLSQSTQDIWAGQSPYLQDVYSGAQGAYGDAMGNINVLQPQVQNQVSGAAGSAAGGYGNQMGGGFAAGLAGQLGPNAYTDAMKSQVANDAQLLKQQNLGSLDARAAAAGMSGSSGYRDQVNDMNNQVDKNALNQMSQIGYNSFNQGIQNQMQLANQMDQNQQAGISNVQNIQQSAMNQFNPSMVGLDATGQYANIIGGPTTLSQSQSQGSSFNNSSSVNNSNSTNSSFNNGMNIGLGMNQAVGVNNGYNTNMGSGASTGDTQTGAVPGIAAGVAAHKMSDARLKTNIELVEQIDGINMYTWDWKDEEMSSPMHYGVIAQEVAETHPEAVMTGDDGYLMVDYSKLGRAGQVALSKLV